ncbi:MAG: tetratricopeptide repeat protein [Endomicrobia bacterium]|nr:tetratricopeptide repeat protein [Endomicrobiia bacterium]
MNKRVAVLSLSAVLFFACPVFAGAQPDNDSGDKALSVKTEEMSVNIDSAKNKKERIALLEQYAEMLTETGQYGAAKNAYERLFGLNPSKKKKFKYYTKLGDIEALQKNYSSALEYYKKAQALYPKDAEINLKMGDILLASGLYNLAEKSFLDALAADKNSDYAKKRLGDISFYRGQYANALGYYNEIDLSHYSEEITVNTAISQRSLGKIDDALRTVTYFLAKGPSAQVHFIAGMLYSDKKMYDESEKHYLDSIDIDGKNFIVYVYLAGIYSLKGDEEKAKAALDKAYALNSLSPVVDLMYAEIAYKSGRIYDARRYAYNAVTKAKTQFVKEQAQRMLEYLNSVKKAE